MIEIVVTELGISKSNSDHRGYIHFDLDDGREFCYRSRVSHDAFFHNPRTKRNRNGRYLYISKHQSEHQIDIDVWNASMERIPGPPDMYANVPRIRVKNLWEFYKLIGYDYKRKKWI
jgi:hypothetical protein